MVLIYPGDQSDLVRQLQIALSRAMPQVACLNPTGVAGPDTIALLKQFQTQTGLPADGIAGPQVYDALRLTFTHAKITEEQFTAAATTLDVKVAAVKAITAVETTGSGFLDDGRPKILFERHQFYNRLIIPRKPGETVSTLMAKRAQFAAANPDICSPSRGGYVGGANEWERLTRARACSDTAALESASYGLFQVMGFNASRELWPDVQSFFRSMHGSEGDHLNAFVGFMKANRSIVIAMQRLDWASVARGYNGPAYAENAYDTKLATAFAKFNAVV